MASSLCTHTPTCPTADNPDREAAQTVAAHPDQGWSLLCNGVLVFEDTGELLPNGVIVAPHRTFDTAADADDVFVRYMEAFRAALDHIGACEACQESSLCADGEALHNRFAALQEQHETRKATDLAIA